jgi:glycosyltransferase involved in cell wall biosynthesis
VKICFFAHKPPPYHGQSIAVETLIDGLVEDAQLQPGPGDAIEVFHVDARLSDDVGQIGQVQMQKLLRVLKYVFQAIWIRLRYGVKYFYYVPAPGLKAAVYRDWIVMGVCRLFYPKVIYHFQAVGLGDWLEKEAKGWERKLSRFLFRRVDLCLGLSDDYASDISKLNPKTIRTLPNGVVDPCPDFESTLLPGRISRWQGFRNSERPDSINEVEGQKVVRILYLSLCYREKGLFDALEGVRLFNELQQNLDANKRLMAKLTVAGKFYLEDEKVEFEELLKLGQYQYKEGSSLTGSIAEYVGFVYHDQKDRLFRENDLFLFPTYYPMEGHPLCLLEALAYGMPTVVSKWRAIPDIYEKHTDLLVDSRRPDQISEAIGRAVSKPEIVFSDYRSRFLARYSKESYIREAKRLFLELESSS